MPLLTTADSRSMTVRNCWDVWMICHSLATFYRHRLLRDRRGAQELCGGAALVAELRQVEVGPAVRSQHRWVQWCWDELPDRSAMMPRESRPRTRWLRVGPWVCRVVSNDAARCRFSTSCPLA